MPATKKPATTTLSPSFGSSDSLKTMHNAKGANLHVSMLSAVDIGLTKIIIQEVSAAPSNKKGGAEEVMQDNKASSSIKIANTVNPSMPATKKPATTAEDAKSPMSPRGQEGATTGDRRNLTKSKGSFRNLNGSFRDLLSSFSKTGSSFLSKSSIDESLKCEPRRQKSILSSFRNKKSGGSRSGYGAISPKDEPRRRKSKKDTKQEEVKNDVTEEAGLEKKSNGRKYSRRFSVGGSKLPAKVDKDKKNTVSKTRKSSLRRSSYMEDSGMSSSVTKGLARMRSSMPDVTTKTSGDMSCKNDDSDEEQFQKTVSRIKAGLKNDKRTDVMVSKYDTTASSHAQPKELGLEAKNDRTEEAVIGKKSKGRKYSRRFSADGSKLPAKEDTDKKNTVSKTRKSSLHRSLYMEDSGMPSSVTNGLARMRSSMTDVTTKTSDDMSCKNDDSDEEQFQKTMSKIKAGLKNDKRTDVMVSKYDTASSPKESKLEAKNDRTAEAVIGKTSKGLKYSRRFSDDGNKRPVKEDKGKNIDNNTMKTIQSSIRRRSTMGHSTKSSLFTKDLSQMRSSMTDVTMKSSDRSCKNDRMRYSMTEHTMKTSDMSCKNDNSDEGQFQKTVSKIKVEQEDDRRKVGFKISKNETPKKTASKAQTKKHYVKKMDSILYGM